MIMDAQLVLSAYEEQNFTIEEVSKRVSSYLDRVPTRRLMLWNTLSSKWTDVIIEVARRFNTEVHL